MTQQFFFRNLFFLIGLNAIIKPLWVFGIDRGVQNVVGAESYGFYFVLFNLSSLTAIVLDLGISHYSNRMVAINRQSLSELFPHMVAIKMLLSGLYLLITCGIGWWLGYSMVALGLLCLVCLNQMLTGWILYIRANINALHLFRLDSILSVLDKTLIIVLCGTLLLVPFLRNRFVIEWFIYVQTLALLVTLIVALKWLARRSSLSLHWPNRTSLQLLPATFPFALLIFLMTVYARVDAVMIQQLLPQNGTLEAGIYAGAFRILDALNQVGYLFSVLLLPMFSRLLSTHDDWLGLLRGSASVLGTFALTAALGISTFAHPIADMLYHEQDEAIGQVLEVLIFSLIGYATIAIFSTLLTAANRLWQLCGLAAGAALLNVLLNFWLIPHWGAVGAAWASCVSVCLLGLAQIVFTYRFMRLSTPFHLWVRMVLFIVMAWIAFRVVLHLSWTAFYQWLLGSVLACALAMITGILSWRQVQHLISVPRH